MTRRLFELATAEDARLSPYCWRARLALAHKGLGFETMAVGFSEIAGIAQGQFKTVPVLHDGTQWIGGSFAIAEHAEAAAPQAPSLFPGDAERRHARFVDDWVTTQLQPQMFRMVVHDVWSRLRPADQDYFRRTREQRLGMSLEAAHGQRDARLAPFRASLEPARLALQRGPFLAGNGPAYVDYILFGALQWARVASPYAMLATDDPLCAWFERCLDLFDRQGRSMPAAH